MKKYIRKIFFFSITVLIILALSCSKDENTTTSKQSIDEALSSNTDFSLYAYAVKKSNLGIFTKGGGPFTFFIPSNSGFASIGITTAADIDKLDPLYLAILTSYHFQGTERTFYEIPEGPNAAMGTQTGLTQYGTRYVTTDKAYINGVEVLDKGTSASNGIYYKISEVMPPPIFSNAITLLQGLGANYSLMLQAITKTATTTSFTTIPSTVFLLPNSVMLANGYDSTTIANISGTAATTLTNALRYHAIPQRIFKSDFKVGNLLTRFSSNSIIVSGSIGSFSIKGKNNTTAIPIGNGVTTTGGVAYSITQMLTP